MSLRSRRSAVAAGDECGSARDVSGVSVFIGVAATMSRLERMAIAAALVVIIAIAWATGVKA